MTAVALNRNTDDEKRNKATANIVIPTSSDTNIFRGLFRFKSKFEAGKGSMSKNSILNKMITPGMSRGMEPNEVMCKHFGVSVQQLHRTQALLRLGVTEEDVHIAERLLAELPSSDEPHSKEERLLGMTRSEISFFKALEVLGADINIIEEERSRRLGNLGIHCKKSGERAALTACFGCNQLPYPSLSTVFGEESKDERSRGLEQLILDQVPHERVKDTIIQRQKEEIELLRQQLLEVESQLVVYSEAQLKDYPVLREKVTDELTSDSMKTEKEDSTLERL